jgi:hypothetical protein
MFLLLPLRKLHPDTYYWIEGKLFHWLLANVAMWSWMAGYDSKYQYLLFISAFFQTELTLLIFF